MTTLKDLDIRYPDLHLSLARVRLPVGWVGIIEDAGRQIVQARRPGTIFESRQIKDRRGDHTELRWYYRLESDAEVPEIAERIEDIIAEAIAASRRTCQACGHLGEPVRQGRWGLVLCPEHARRFLAGARPGDVVEYVDEE